VTTSSDDERAGPPARVRAMGRALNATVARAPWMWPLLRAPVRRYFDRLAADWDMRTQAGSAEHLAALAAGLLHVSPHPERALDVGTGTGAGALLLAREFPRASVRGVDVSAEMVAKAKAKVGLDPDGRIAFKVADAARLPWPEESFDLVIQLNMPPFFAEVSRVLRPAGQVVVATSSGERTPFFTPNAVLRRGFARWKIAEQAVGGAGPGTFWVGRREG